MASQYKPCVCGNNDLETFFAMSFVPPDIASVKCKRCHRSVSGPDPWVTDVWNNGRNTLYPGEMITAEASPANRAKLEKGEMR